VNKASTPQSALKNAVQSGVLHCTLPLCNFCCSFLPSISGNSPLASKEMKMSRRPRDLEKQKFGPMGVRTQQLPLGTKEHLVLSAGAGMFRKNGDPPDRRTTAVGSFLRSIFYSYSRTDYLEVLENIPHTPRRP
jgi:hypothetical protein